MIELLSGIFYNNDYYQIENFQFADRTLSLEDMRREGINFVGTEGDDELTDAHDENEVSFFTGGKGNDVLDGSYGADTYIFAKGHGQDVISEYDTYQSGKQDTLRFTDVNYNDVRFRRENDDLILFGYHGNDRITIQNFLQQRLLPNRKFPICRPHIKFRRYAPRGH